LKIGSKKKKKSDGLEKLTGATISGVGELTEHHVGQWYFKKVKVPLWTKKKS